MGSGEGAADDDSGATDDDAGAADDELPESGALPQAARASAAALRPAIAPSVLRTMDPPLKAPRIGTADRPENGQLRQAIRGPTGFGQTPHAVTETLRRWQGLNLPRRHLSP